MKLDSTNLSIHSNEDMSIVKITTKTEKMLLSQENAEELRDLLNDYFEILYNSK